MNLKQKTKLVLKKKQLKNLSADNLCLPKHVTKQIAGGVQSFSVSYEPTQKDEY